MNTNPHLKTVPIVLRTLKKLPKTSALGNLHAKDPFIVLIATMLSARSKDETTEQLVPVLMKAYPTPKALAEAPLDDVERIIKRSGFFRQKAKNIQAVARIIYEKYKNRVPKNLEELTSLPGVGKKTACCVLVYAYDIPEIPVDVHVHVISQRLGWTTEKTPEKIHDDLKRHIPKKHLLDLNEMFVSHGKKTCTTLRPKCSACVIRNYCPRIGVKESR